MFSQVSDTRRSYFKRSYSFTNVGDGSEVGRIRRRDIHMNAFEKAREEVQKEQSKVEMMQIESRHSYQLKSSV